jgi:uncharacterized membrane protein YfcA
VIAIEALFPAIETGHALFLLIFAVGVGVYGTLVGAGGGFLIVPMLLLAFTGPPYNFTPQEAAGTSLFAVFLNGVSGTVTYAQQRRIDFQSGWYFSLTSVPGSILGAYVGRFFTSAAFVLSFGALLIALAAFMILRPAEARIVAAEEAEAAVPPRRWYVQRRIFDRLGQEHSYEYHQPGGMALSFLIGMLGSILGIGGGPIIVPSLLYLFSFPAYIATATSTFIVAVSSFSGTVSHLGLGNVRLTFALILGVGVIAGAQIGARLSTRLRGPWLIRLLSIALIIAGGRLILRGLEMQ